MAELLGRSAGYSHGRGGSMHVAIPEIGLLGTNGIVGGGHPDRDRRRLRHAGRRRATTSRSASSARARPRTGVFGEALNLAALWQLPLVFICENNQYVELTPQKLHVAGEIWRRGERARHAAASAVDGNDVDAVSRRRRRPRWSAPARARARR